MEPMSAPISAGRLPTRSDRRPPHGACGKGGERIDRHQDRAIEGIPTILERQERQDRDDQAETKQVDENGQQDDRHKGSRKKREATPIISKVAPACTLL